MKQSSIYLCLLFLGGSCYAEPFEAQDYTDDAPTASVRIAHRGNWITLGPGGTYNLYMRVGETLFIRLKQTQAEQGFEWTYIFPIDRFIIEQQDELTRDVWKDGKRIPGTKITIKKIVARNEGVAQINMVNVFQGNIANRTKNEPVYRMTVTIQ